MGLPVEVGQRVATALRYGQRDIDVRYRWGEVVDVGKKGVQVHLDVAHNGKRDIWAPAHVLYAKAPDGVVRPVRDVARLRASVSPPEPAPRPVLAPEEPAPVSASPPPSPQPQPPPAVAPASTLARVDAARRLAAEMSPDEVFAVMGVFAEMAAEGVRRAVAEAESALQQAQRDRADAESILDALRTEIATAQEVHEGTVRGELAARERLGEAQRRLAAVTKHLG